MKKHMIRSRDNSGPFRQVYFLCGGTKKSSLFYDNHGAEPCKRCLAVFNKGLDVKLVEEATIMSMSHPWKKVCGNCGPTASVRDGVCERCLCIVDPESK